MVKFDKGITNLHVPSDIIIDASPACHDNVVQVNVGIPGKSSRYQRL